MDPSPKVDPWELPPQVKFRPIDQNEIAQESLTVALNDNLRRFRATGRGLEFHEIPEVLARLELANRAELEQLRRALLRTERPDPRIQRDPAAKGAPTVQGVLRLLSGEASGGEPMPTSLERVNRQLNSLQQEWTQIEVEAIKNGRPVPDRSGLEGDMLVLDALRAELMRLRGKQRGDQLGGRLMIGIGAGQEGLIELRPFLLGSLSIVDPESGRRTPQLDKGAYLIHAVGHISYTHDHGHGLGAGLNLPFMWVGNDQVFGRRAGAEAILIGGVNFGEHGEVGVQMPIPLLPGIFLQLQFYISHPSLKPIARGGVSLVEGAHAGISKVSERASAAFHRSLLKAPEGMAAAAAKTWSELSATAASIKEQVQRTLRELPTDQAVADQVTTNRQARAEARANAERIARKLNSLDTLSTPEREQLQQALARLLAGLFAQQPAIFGELSLIDDRRERPGADLQALGTVSQEPRFELSALQQSIERCLDSLPTALQQQLVIPLPQPDGPAASGGQEAGHDRGGQPAELGAHL